MTLPFRNYLFFVNLKMDCFGFLLIEIFLILSFYSSTNALKASLIVLTGTISIFTLSSFDKAL